MSSAGERSLNKQLVLDEDEYTAALSHIIARDFFPSLVHLDATDEYLDALQTRDPHLIGATVRRIEELNNTPAISSRRGAPYQTPSQTPYGLGPSDTPLRTPSGEPPQKRTKLNADLSLDEFQARYTSEDNSSFTQILDSENQKRKEKWGWAWEAQKRVEEQRDKMIEGRERMLIEAPAMTGVREKFVIEAPTVAGLLTESGEDKVDKGKGKEMEGEAGEEEEKEEENREKALVVSKAQEIEEEVDILAPKKDTRSAGVDGWKFKARNSLMFPPDSDSSPYHAVASAEKVKNPKVVKYGNTRLEEDNHTTSVSRGASAPPSPTRSRIEAAIMGTPYRPKTPPGQFKLVPNLPSPTAAELGPTAVKQLMTWGTLNATPRIISQPGDIAEPSTPFHIAPTSAREDLSRKLANKASKSLRAKAELLGLTPGIRPSIKRGDMGPPSMTPRRSQAAGNLTPAARRLLERTTMGTAAAKRAEAMERAARWDSGSSKGKEKDLNRVRWTPTPNSVR